MSDKKYKITIFSDPAQTILEFEHLKLRAKISTKLMSTEDPEELSNTNLVPIRTGFGNNQETNNIVMLVTGRDDQGIGKIFIHDEITKNNEMEKQQSDKMKLLSTILMSSAPLVIKLQNYETGLTMKFHALMSFNTKSTDVIHLASVLVKNLECNFPEAETIVMGNSFINEIRSEVRSKNRNKNSINRNLI